MNSKNIWVFIEKEKDTLPQISLELLGKGKILAEEKNKKLVAVLFGKDVAKLAEECVYHGADRVLVVEGEEYEAYSTDAYTYALAQLIEKYEPLVLLLPASANGRDLGGRLSARLKLGLVAGCLDVYFEEDSDIVNWVRPTFDGKLLSSIQTSTLPQLGTVNKNVFKEAKRDISKRGEIIQENLPFPAEKIRTVIEKTKKKTQTRKPNMMGFGMGIVDEESPLEKAKLVVCAGMGVGDEKGMALVKELAEVLDAEFGVSKPLVDKEWAPYNLQIGVTGKTIHPAVYIAVGVSGAQQHWMGVKDSDVIIAINTDKDAPIMSEAHYAFHGDLFEIIPPLIEQLKA